MTWLEMVAHYKGYRNLLQENAPFTPLVWEPREFRKAGQRPDGRGQRVPERPRAPRNLSVWEARQSDQTAFGPRRIVVE
ncbi:MAG: hypothetical protein RMK65_12395 [Anaerolineae bacterium]|nr:hypothetical protein [Anaerolineae bacterium]MCX8066535.1 hypothetical protein [Anaerolineae bacterium]MDW7992888.1 hypothetical protein [Anaerolineae bacterium]